MHAFKRWLIVLALFSILPLSAGIIYSNIDALFPGNSPGADSTGASYIATTFTTTGGGNLSSVSIDVAVSTGPSQQITVGLYGNSLGLPGALLESWSLTPPIFPNFPPGSLTTLASIAKPLLSAGSQYWFVINQGNLGILLNWAENDEAINGGAWAGNSINSLSQFGQPFPTPGIQLNSTVPEPSTSLLLAVALFILAAQRKSVIRNRR